MTLCSICLSHTWPFHDPCDSCLARILLELDKLDDDLSWCE